MGAQGKRHSRLAFLFLPPRTPVPKSSAMILPQLHLERNRMAIKPDLGTPRVQSKDNVTTAIDALA